MIEPRDIIADALARLERVEWNVGPRDRFDFLQIADAVIEEMRTHRWIIKRQHPWAISDT